MWKSSRPMTIPTTMRRQDSGKIEDNFGAMWKPCNRKFIQKKETFITKRREFFYQQTRKWFAIDESLYFRKVCCCCCFYFLAPVFQTKDKKETWHAVVRQLTCVMRKRRGRNTRISFPTQKKREKGHNNNQGRNYIVSFFLCLSHLNRSYFLSIFR